MSDGKVEIETKLDDTGVAKGLNALTKKINSIADNKTLTAFSKLGASITGLGSAFSMVTKTVGAVKNAINDCSEAFKTQVKAETLLQTAVKNNPLLDGSSIVKLQNYASSLQSISTFGDEELLPFMAQLASAGRTESEIMEIMQTSIDIASSGTMSLESAVKNLNKTFSGLSGELGEAIPSIKGLTQEELKSGKAVEVLKEQYKGMAENVAKTTGTSQQLKNAWGDLKEELGAPFEKAMSPMRAFFTELFSNWGTALKLKRQYTNLNEINESGKGTLETLQEELASAEELLKAERKKYEEAKLQNSINAKNVAVGMGVGNFVTTIVSDEEIKKLENRILELKKLIKQEEELAKQEEERQQQENEKKAKEEKVNNAIDKYKETVAKAEEEIELKEKLGEKLTEEEKQRTLLNTKVQAYMQMLKDAEGLLDPNKKGFAQDEAKKIQEETDALAKKIEIMEEGEEVLKKLEKELDPNDIIDIQKEALQNYLTMLEESGNADIELIERIKNALKELDEQQQNQSKNKKSLFSDEFKEGLTIAEDFNSKVFDLTSNITEFLNTRNENQTANALAQLEEDYNNDLISYEEYCEKKKQIEKESAQEQYRIKMWEWHAQLLEATSNMALAAIKAFSSAANPIVGGIMAALVATAGAVQLATISANKPVAPSFQSGGFLTGNSYSGDKIAFKGNAGEAILNASEQRQFMAYANGTAQGTGINMNVQVINNRANDTKTSQEITPNGLRIVIDKIVNTSMAEGKYNNSMDLAENKKNGAIYL